MQRISSWTDLVTALGRFRYGSVTGGVPPTPLKAEWLNMVQEEIANVVLAAGIALDHQQEDQLKQAIVKMIGNYLPLSGGTLTGLLKATKGVRAAKGLPTAGNASQAGYGFGEDGDTGLYATGGTDADGSAVAVMVDGAEVARFGSEVTLTGLLRAAKGVRAAKGMPLAGNASQAGYGFGSDGDTGLYATGGTDSDGSAVVLVVDGVEVVRFKSDGTLTIAGAHTPYHTGNKPSMLAVVYPVGSIYMNASDSTNPATLFGFGTWVGIGIGRMLIGAGSFTDTRGETRTFALGSSGGTYSHALTAAEMPEHTHDLPQGVTAGPPGPYASGDDMTSQVQGYVPSQSTGGGQAHNNMSPYLTVHMWRRTA